MRVLLDHNIPHDLIAAFSEEFDVFVTLDTDIEHQQPTQSRDLGIVVIDVHPAVPENLLEQMYIVNELVRSVGQSKTLSGVHDAKPDVEVD